MLRGNRYVALAREPAKVSVETPSSAASINSLPPAAALAVPRGWVRRRVADPAQPSGDSSLTDRAVSASTDEDTRPTSCIARLRGHRSVGSSVQLPVGMTDSIHLSSCKNSSVNMSRTSPYR